MVFPASQRPSWRVAGDDFSRNLYRARFGAVTVNNTSSGLRPDAGDFASDITCAWAQISLRRNCVVSCSAKRKVTKEKAAPVSRAHSRIPCAACLTSAAVELARCAQGRPRAQTVLAETPRPSELLGATQGPQPLKAAVLVGRKKRRALRGLPYGGAGARPVHVPHARPARRSSGGRPPLRRKGLAPTPRR